MYVDFFGYYVKSMEFYLFTYPSNETKTCKAKLRLTKMKGEYGTENCSFSS